MRRSLLKHERLLQLKNAGLNTVDFLWFPPGVLDEGGVLRFFEKHGRISFRQYTADPTVGNLPGIYDVEKLESVFDFIKAHRRNDSYAIINQGVETDQNNIRGCLSLFDFYCFRVEYFVGQGNPRKIERKTSEELTEIFGDIDTGFDFPRCHNWRGDYSGLFKELVIMTRAFLTDARPLILEFEWRPEAVGWKPDFWLFWEWRIENLPR